jgi:Recombination directionality factor-like
MSAVLSLLDLTPRSLVEERAIRPPTIGKIRPGIKVLTRAAQGNQQAVEMYKAMVAAGDSYETIGKVIETKLKLKNALIPKNVPYFVCRRSDFTNPATADEILKLYGEDWGDGLKLYRFPVMFAFDDWLRNVPNEMAVYTTTSRQFFSQYGPDGKRYCKTYAPVERDERAQRARRSFGGRLIVHRQDDDIPDGVCDPHACPQYQARKCNLSASFLFVIPEIKGLGLIELPTNSIYVLQKAYGAMQTVSLARGRLLGTRFWLSKREFDITRVDENGQAVRQKQMLTVLDADIDLGALLDGAEAASPALESANQAVALIEATDATRPIEGQSAGIEPEASTDPADFEPDVDETVEDKLDRMSYLLQRLGLNQAARQEDFKILGHVKFGRGWTKRPADIDSMNRCLAAALLDQNELEAEIAKAVQMTSFV